MLSGGLRTKGLKKQSQENQPLITVVTVVRDGEKTLEETILSVVNQTYRNVEYILVDGASTDGTLDVIKKYEDRIDYWISEPDKGIYDAMNKGIDLAAGEWINFMNSGDGFYKITTIKNIFDKTSYSNYDIIYGDASWIINNGIYIIKASPLEVLKKHMIFVHQSSFVRSNLIKIMKFDGTYRICGDYNFFYKCFLNNIKFIYISAVIAKYEAENGVSTNYKIREYEIARVHDINKKFIWKMKFAFFYSFYLFKHMLKMILPQEFVKNIKKRNMDKLIYNKKGNLNKVT